jgi:hypothetical protein
MGGLLLDLTTHIKSDLLMLEKLCINLKPVIVFPSLMPNKHTQHL